MNLPTALQLKSRSKDVFAVCNGKTISYAGFWKNVSTMTSLLPKQQYLVNYCEDRYLFCVALFAAALNGSTTLLPPSKSSGIIEELEREYSSLCVISDQQLLNFSFDKVFVDLESLEKQTDKTVISENQHIVLDPQQIVVIAFTSGSTGRPKPQAKHWGGLVDCAKLAIQQLGLTNQQHAMLSTTPPQHMFGLETSVIWPYVSDLVMVNHRPFYPEEIRLLIQSMPYPVVLCSTPTHLRACVSSIGEWSNLASIICSTAPLSPELANQIETVMGANLYELYGSTETLSYASRRTSQQSAWTLYPGVTLGNQSKNTQLNATYLQQPVLLDDMLDIEPNGTFKVIGRATDLVKIGGKRASILELNQRLQAISGITDGCFFRIERSEIEQRLGVIVVSELKADDIITALKQHLDEVFLPRILYYTEKIPRNGIGKLLGSELNNLLAQLRCASIDD